MNNLFFHLRRLALPSLLSVTLVCGLPLAYANGVSAVGNQFEGQSKHQLIREINATLLPYKTDELAGRQPLILVHGIGGTDGSKYSEWDEFLKFTDKNPDFQKRFKVYLFHYDSFESVPLLSQLLQVQLKSFLATLADKQTVRIVAYSEGGLLTRNAMQDVELLSRADKVITIATPFHGSPLASAAWFSNQVEKESGLSPVRLSHRFAYWVAGKKHPSFQNDFKWDNFDGAMAAQFAEAFEYQQSTPPVPQVGDVSEKYAIGNQKNLITYGSYFGPEEEANQKIADALGVQTELPKEKRQFKNLFRRNILFSYVNKIIAKLPPLAIPFKKQEADKGAGVIEVSSEEAHILVATEVAEGTGLPEGMTQTTPISDSQLSDSMMPYNDGISPISSSLWLGRYTPQFESQKNPLQRLWSALRSLKGTDSARLFPGMDHRNWMDGETRTQSNKVQDLLNPDDSPRTVFEWIVYDLMS